MADILLVAIVVALVLIALGLFAIADSISKLGWHVRDAVETDVQRARRLAEPFK